MRTHVSMLVLLLVSMISGCGERTPRSEKKVPVTTTVSVAAAADLKYALDDLIIEFKEAHPNIDVQPTYGSSGNFFAQLSN